MRNPIVRLRRGLSRDVKFNEFEEGELVFVKDRHCMAVANENNELDFMSPIFDVFEMKELNKMITASMELDMSPFFVKLRYDNSKVYIVNKGRLKPLIIDGVGICL